MEDLKPGRGLDKLIAEKVMGWTEIKTEVIPETGWDLYGVNSKGEGDFLIPDYSTDISAAWEVVEKLISIGYMVDIQTHTRFHQVQLEKLVGETDSGGIWQGGESIEGQSAPHAICLAALKAIQ